MSVAASYILLEASVAGLEPPKAKVFTGWSRSRSRTFKSDPALTVKEENIISGSDTFGVNDYLEFLLN